MSFYIYVVLEGILLVPRVKNPIKVLEEEGKKVTAKLEYRGIEKEGLRGG
jgi:hypothetical protein